jgi:hypothetical protein
MSSDEDLTPKTETQLIAAIYERAQARKRLRVAGAPEVGIFRVVDGKAAILENRLAKPNRGENSRTTYKVTTASGRAFFNATALFHGTRNTTTTRAAALSTTQ